MSRPPASMVSLFAPPGSAAEHRLRVQHAAEHRAALRTSELASQTSPLNDSRERIRIWERLHALRLPHSASHVLVGVIATQTCLSLAQVREEQRRRAAIIVWSKTKLGEGSEGAQWHVTATARDLT
jgi:hypothetical protein